MSGEVDTPVPQGQPSQPLGAAAMAVARDRMLAARAAREAGGAAARKAAAPLATPAVQAPDPLGRPYQLPSRGLPYQREAPGWDGTIIIAPTRGQNEELLAGTADQPEVKLKLLRHLMKTCVRWGPIPMDAITVPDWTAASLHFLAMCAGSDEVHLRPVHKVVGCNKPSPIVFALTALPCINLRLAQPGEEPTPAPEDEDPDLAILREMEAEDQAATTGPADRVVTQADLEEPHCTALETSSGLEVFWRSLRLLDVVKAEEFTQRAAEEGRAAGDPELPSSPLHTFLLAAHVVGLGKKKVSRLEAMTWVRAQASPVLTELRDAIEAKTYGYQTAPRFECRACGGTFRMRLPLDQGMFRRRPARPANQGGKAIST